ncbi:MAG: thrombospondin type 3 repeat-containing protein [Phycisphaerae bacterium]
MSAQDASSRRTPATSPPPREPATWRWGLRLSAFGLAGNVLPLPAVEPAAVDGRIEYRHGPLTEWYVRDHRGIEQGFTLPARPWAGAAWSTDPFRRCGELELVMEIGGSLRPRLGVGDGRIDFVDADGRRRLEYSHLFAFDAAGTTLPARLAVHDGRLSIFVDDTDAVYPVTIDPLIFAQQAKLTAADAAAGDEFGECVALSGDTVVVGSPRDDDAGSDSGSAYVFFRRGTSISQQAKLTDSGAAAGDRFGEAVAVDADTVVVGVRRDDDDGDSSGSACVFVRSGTNWTQQARLTAADAAAGDEFGRSIAVEGDIAVVGARRDDDAAGADQGAAYIFTRSGTVWSQAAKLTAADAAAGDQFGESVAISGDTVVVGARFDGDAGAKSGSAYVFVRNGATWTQQAKLTASDAASMDFFGESVALSSDTIVVGASGNDDGGSNSGSAYVFVRNGAVWTQQAKLLPADATANDQFGRSVAIDGGTVLIGARFDDDGAVNSGSAYVFTHSGTTWTQATEFKAGDAAANDLFGESVAIKGDSLVVGAFHDDDAGASSGSAYLFEAVVACCLPAGSCLDMAASTCAAMGGLSNGAGSDCATQPDTDGDGVLDCLDNCPNDPNKTEPGVCGCGVADVDTDGDGTFDCMDACPNDPAKTAPGTCGCGVADTDTDGDGTVDCIDMCPTDPAKVEPGLCGCGTADTDSDGDGTPDCNDACPNDAAKIAPGTCGCGTADTDTDGDGTPDCNDACPADPGKIDPGICGCGAADTDSDGDGVADCNDRCPGGPDVDSDGDGVLDCDDACPADPDKTEPGICGCGVPEIDSDGDGTPDCRDACPADPNKTKPGSCGCGMPDADSDGDGTADCADACPNDPSKTSPDACGCGVPDIDTDGDGTLDCRDRCPDDPSKTEPGACGCGVPDTDRDGDGVADCNDRCPDDPDRTVPGACGCGVAETDTDSDGMPDCLDDCPNDPDKTVPGACGCGVAETDTDGDGVADCVDNCPETANADQADSDANGVGDVCEPLPEPPPSEPPPPEVPPTEPPVPNPPSTPQDCGDGLCGAGVGITVPLLLIGLGPLRRRRRGRRVD